MNKRKNKDKVTFVNDNISSDIMDSESIFGEQKKHKASDVSFVSISEQEKSIVSGNIPLKQKQKDVSFVSIDEQQKDILNKE